MEFEQAVARAWLVFERGRLEEADRLWSELITSANSDVRRDRCAGSRAYVLVALGRFDEARAVYHDLYARHGSHRYLHQIGMVEREAGNLSRALQIFRREAELIADGDTLAYAANLYERALLQHLFRRARTSIELMERCVTAALDCADPTMVGAAYRLKGDVLAVCAPRRARAAYQLALESFARARDQFGVAEVEDRLASLLPAGGDCGEASQSCE